MYVCDESLWNLLEVPLMKIAVNTRLLLKNKLEGIGWFSYETLKRMVQIHHEHQFYFIFDRKYAEEFVFADNVFPVVCFPPTSLPFLITYFFQKRLPKIIQKTGAEIFISPDGWIPCNLNIPVVNVIHDINFEHHPEFLPSIYRKHFKKWFPCFAKKASHLVTVSEYSKQDIIRTYEIDENNISVVPNGVNVKYESLIEKQISETREQYTQGHSYFIFIGSIHPRKNLSRIIKAFYRFKNNTNADSKFLIIGSKLHKYFENKQESIDAMYKEDIIFLERQSVDSLKYLLGSALALTYVSMYEGFGIPIIEGFQAGIPVITSNVTSMPEVAGDAALLVNPSSIIEIADAMERIYLDSKLRSQLIEKGKERVKKYSWDKSAEKFWNVIESEIKKIPLH